MVRPSPSDLRLVRSGGVVGGRRAWTLRPADLGAAAQRFLQKAPTQKPRTASTARDRLVYSFVIKGSRRVTFEETALPPSLRTLVARVTRRPPDPEGETSWA